MFAMLYTVRLDANFDTDAFRGRVAERSTLFVGLPGLAHKSFLFDHDSHVYASFLIWRSHDAWRKFLVSDLFKGITSSLGRPRVRTWSVLNFDFGADFGGETVTPALATREVDLIAPQDDLATVTAREAAAHAARLKERGLHSHLVAIDAERWELVRYALWRDKASCPTLMADCVHEYEVLSLAESMRPKAGRRRKAATS